MRTLYPENQLPIFLLAPAADAAGRTSTAYIDVSNLRGMVKVIAFIDQGNAATVALTPKQASDSTGTGTKVLSAVVDIWSNLDMAASEVFVQRTAATSYTTDAGVKVKMVVFNIHPQVFDTANGFKYLALTTGASNAANITSAFIIGDPRYSSETAGTY